MLAEFIDRIISLSTPEVKKLNGRYYGNSDVKVIPQLDDMPKQLQVHSLDSVVRLIVQDHAGPPLAAVREHPEPQPRQCFQRLQP